MGELRFLNSHILPLIIYSFNLTPVNREGCPYHAFPSAHPKFAHQSPVPFVIIGLKNTPGLVLLIVKLKQATTSHTLQFASLKVNLTQIVPENSQQSITGGGGR